MIQPENLDSVVDDFIKVFDLDPNKILKISKQDKGIETSDGKRSLIINRKMRTMINNVISNQCYSRRISSFT